MTPRFPLYYPNALCINAAVENGSISNDEPTIHGEEPSQREACHRWNRRRNILRHHTARERDPTQPISRNKASDVGETPDERGSHLQRNSRRGNCRLAQKSEHEAA